VRRILALALLLCTLSCVTATPEKRAAQVLGTIEETVKAGMNVAGALYRAGQVTETQWTEIAKVYSRVQAVESSAIAFLSLYKSTKTGDPMALVQAAQTAANELLALIERFKVKNAGNTLDTVNSPGRTSVSTGFAGPVDTWRRPYGC